MRSISESFFVGFVAIRCVVVGVIIGMRLVSSLVIWRDKSFAGVVMWINLGRGNGVERYVSVASSVVALSLLVVLS